MPLSYWEKHSTLDLVMVSVVSSILTGGNFFHEIFKPLDLKSDLKCKCDRDKLESI